MKIQRFTSLKLQEVLGALERQTRFESGQKLGREGVEGREPPLTCFVPFLSIFPGCLLQLQPQPGPAAASGKPHRGDLQPGVQAAAIANSTAPPLSR